MSKNSQQYYTTKRLIRDSGVQILCNICTHFGRYLYYTKCSWIKRHSSIYSVQSCCQSSRGSRNTLFFKDCCSKGICVCSNLIRIDYFMEMQKGNQMLLYFRYCIVYFYIKIIKSGNLSLGIQTLNEEKFGKVDQKYFNTADLIP